MTNVKKLLEVLEIQKLPCFDASQVVSKTFWFLTVILCVMERYVILYNISRKQI